MRRPFLWIGPAFAWGILVSRLFPGHPAQAFTMLVALLPLLLFFRRNKAFMGLLLAGFFLMGMLAESLERELPLNHISRIPDTDGSLLFWAPERPQKAVLTGRVQTLPEISEKGKRRMVSFVLSASDIYAEGKVWAAVGKVQIFLFNCGVPLQYGDRIRVWGELKPPELRRNPGQFDYRNYLAEQGIYHLFQGFGSRSVRILEKGRPSLLAWVFRVRERIKERLDRHLPYPENEILAALLIGLRRKIPDSIRDDFAKTGTAHVLSVSGLNVSIVAGLVYLLFRFLHFPPKWNALASLGFVAIYVLISGYNAPVVRAGIMSAILLAGFILERDSDLLNSLAVAFFALLFYRPGNLFHAGFQLSFLSVLAILLLLRRFRSPEDMEARENAGLGLLKKVGRFYQGVFLSTVAATVGTLPLVLYYFRIASPVSFLANLAVVPLVNIATFVGFLLLPFLFLGEGVGSLLMKIPLWAIQVSLAFNHFFSRIPYASFYVASPPVYVLWAYYAGLLALILLAPRYKARLKSPWVLGTLAACALVVGFLVSYLERDLCLRIHLLDLKQGRVALVEFPGKRAPLLINTGKGRPQEEWKWQVKPFLMSRGIQSIGSILLVSLYEQDIGGLEGILGTFSCREVFLPSSRGAAAGKVPRLIALLRRKKAAVRFLSDATVLRHFDGGSVEWDSDGKGSVLRIVYNDKRVVLVLEGSPDLLPADLSLRLQPGHAAHTVVIDPVKKRVESFAMK